MPILCPSSSTNLLAAPAVHPRAESGSRSIPAASQQWWCSRAAVGKLAVSLPPLAWFSQNKEFSAGNVHRVFSVVTYLSGSWRRGWRDFGHWLMITQTGSFPASLSDCDFPDKVQAQLRAWHLLGHIPTRLPVWGCSFPGRRGESFSPGRWAVLGCLARRSPHCLIRQFTGRHWLFHLPVRKHGVFL